MSKQEMTEQTTNYRMLMFSDIPGPVMHFIFASEKGENMTAAEE